MTNNPDGTGLTGTDIIGGDPKLAGLASNGGPTQTMALQAGSPAIATGITAVFPGTDTDITTDQSGADLNSPPDLGALQYVPAATPTVTISTGSLDLGSTTAGTAGSIESYTVSGSNLTADITIVAPSGVELSDDGGTTWHTSLDLAESGGTVNTTTIDARIAATASVGEISGEISNTSTGATAQDVSVSGTVNAVPTITVSTESLNLGSTTAGTAGSTESYTVGGDGLTADILIDAPTGVELSNDDGMTWHTSLDLAESGGTVNTTTIDARIAASASVGGISGSITNTGTGATEQDVSVSGTVNAVPTIAISTGSLDLGTTTTGTAGSTESYTVSGSGLTADILITTPIGVELSDDGGITWSTVLDLTESGGTVALTTIDARIAASSAVRGINGYIANISTGAHEQDVSVSGTVNAVPTVTVSTGSLDLGTTTAGTAGTTESYAVSGSGLTADILIDAPTGVELSDDGGHTWTASLDLTETAGTVASTTIDVRISASAPVGTIGAAIANSSGGAVVQDVAVGGTVQASSEAGAVVSSSPQTFYGETVTLTATFQATANGSAPMTGTVAFYDGSQFLGTATLVPSGSSNPTAAIRPLGVAAGTVSGSASLTTSSLDVGNHVITAVYSGNAQYGGATSTTPVAIQVAPAQTSTTLAASTTAQGTILTATVVVTSPGNPPIGGTVAFFDGSSLLGTAPLLNGIATLNAGVLPAGNHAFSAVYSGGGTASTSGATTAVSTASPTITRVVRYGFHHQPTYVVLYFSSPLDAATAEDIANYSLVGPIHRSGKHSYTVGIKSAAYDPASNTVTLSLVGRWNAHWHWRLTVNGTRPGRWWDPRGRRWTGRPAAGPPARRAPGATTSRRSRGRTSRVGPANCQPPV